MEDKINIADPVYFYDDRSKYDYMFKLTTILYVDDEICLCVAKCTNESESIPDEKFLFKIFSGQVIIAEYDSWYATNDVEWVQKVQVSLN